MSLRDPSKVLSIDDLGDILGPFFATPAGRAMGKLLFKLIKIDEINTITKRHNSLSGSDFASAILCDPDVDVSYRLHGAENLELMRGDGTFITASNHPFGGIDGLILVAIIGSIRPDFKVLVNNFLSNIKPLADVWIPIQPRRNKKNYRHTPEKNISGLRMAAKQLHRGHPLGIFPAGGIAHYDWARDKPEEQPWQMNSVRIMKQARCPIFPVMFGGRNSRFFYALGRISYDLNTLRIPAEILNKKGQTIDVYIGEPILPCELDALPTLKETRSYLMERSLSLIK